MQILAGAVDLRKSGYGMKQQLLGIVIEELKSNLVLSTDAHFRQAMPEISHSIALVRSTVVDAYDG